MNAIEAKIWLRQQKCVHPADKIRATTTRKIVCDCCGMEEDQ